MKIGYIAVLMAAALGVFVCTGCTGVGLRAEAYRIDNREEHSDASQMPLRCFFYDCNGGKAS